MSLTRAADEQQFKAYSVPTHVDGKLPQVRVELTRELTNERIQVNELASTRTT